MKWRELWGRNVLTVLESSRRFDDFWKWQLKKHPGMFHDTDSNTLIERAYDVQGDRLAMQSKGEKEMEETTVEAVKR